MSDITSTIIYISLFFGLYYQIFLLITFFENKGDNKDGNIASMKSPFLPNVTIIVPCFNEEKTLEKTVDSLLGLRYPKDKLSIIVVDDGSKDNTYSVAQRLAKNNNRIRAFTQKNGGKFTALNFGIKLANTEIVGCLDADSSVHPDALLRMIPYFKKKKVVAVTPAMKVYNPINALQKMQNVEYNMGIFLKNIMGKLDAIHVTPGPFSIFKKDIFNKIGYFRHAHNTEDMEIAFRIQENRYKIANCPNAFVYTITPNTVKKLYKQRTRWTYGFLKNMKDYKHMILNPKYGNIGMLTLPFAVIATIAALFVASNTLYNFSDYIISHIQKYLVTGINIHIFSFDPFFLNTNSIMLLSITMFSLTFAFIVLAWRLAEGKFRLKIDIFYYVTMYGFIAPLWLAKATYNMLTSRGTPWR